MPAQATPAQEAPAPAPMSPEVFDVTVPESVMAGHILMFPRPDNRERHTKTGMIPSQTARSEGQEDPG